MTELIIDSLIFLAGMLTGSAITAIAIKKYIERKIENMGLGGVLNGF